jgi:hypothetical protein
MYENLLCVNSLFPTWRDFKKFEETETSHFVITETPESAFRDKENALAQTATLLSKDFIKYLAMKSGIIVFLLMGMFWFQYWF